MKDITLESVLTLADEIILGTHASYTVLAGIDGTLIYVDLRELICRFSKSGFYRFIANMRIRSHLAISTCVTAFTRALVRYGVVGILPRLARSLVQTRRGIAWILEPLTFRS